MNNVRRSILGMAILGACAGAAMAQTAGSKPASAAMPAAAIPAASRPASAASFGGAGAAGAEELKVGDPAPDFALPKPGRPAGSDEVVKLSDYRGQKNVLLAFYVRAFTSGCTLQLCGYRDDTAMFQQAQTEILAISADTPVDNERFKTQEEFAFPVLGDPKGEVINKYGLGVWMPNGTLVARRAVFLIDKQGVIRYVDTNYSVHDSKDALYQAIQALSGEAASGPVASKSVPGASASSAPASKPAFSSPSSTQPNLKAAKYYYADKSKKYHLDPNCSGLSQFRKYPIHETSEPPAGLEPCKMCAGG
ncbi:MAG: peroxiredoxin [Candidatus Sumerlaeota bacterium]|nr:peroxiredoxin [Candidatus Sumerlaeota bacterium]